LDRSRKKKHERKTNAITIANQFAKYPAQIPTVTSKEKDVTSAATAAVALFPEPVLTKTKAERILREKILQLAPA